MSAPADTDQPTLAVQAHEWRKREVQAIGAAISNRSWHAVEQAYNSLRDKMDRAGCWWAPDTRTTHEPRPAGDLREDVYGHTVIDRMRDHAENGTMEPGYRKDLFELLDLATHSPAPMAGEKALRLARPIVEADWYSAREAGDSDWEGLSWTALDAIDKALAAHPSTQEG